MTTAIATYQIHMMQPHRPFTFVNTRNGDGKYEKVGNTHVRRWGNAQNVCLPVSTLTEGIRTLVNPAED